MRETARGALLAPGTGYQQVGGSPQVRSLQHRLATMRFRPGPIDGVYGPLTTAAVERLQNANGLPVDGIVGPRTRWVLDRGRVSRVAPVTGQQGPTLQPPPPLPPLPLLHVPPVVHRHERKTSMLPVTIAMIGCVALSLMTISLGASRMRRRVRRERRRGETGHGRSP
jgi:hypothetical protein